MMRNPGKGLEERVRRLEADVEVHRQELERLRLLLAPSREEAGPDRDGHDPGTVGGLVPAHQVPGVSGRRAPEEALSEGRWGTRMGRSAGGGWRDLEPPFGLANLRRWEWWMNKVGIALLLTGLVFLFKFSWDSGWLQILLTPAVRVGLGLLLGSALVWVGLRVYSGRRAFAQVVLGGGIGAYYITGFAAYGMLGVFSYPVAFAFMVAVTLLAFALALRQDGAALAVIGVSGGLATPFLLYDGVGSPMGLVLYTGLILTGAMGMYLRKGWHSLLIVACIGYWAVLFMGYAKAVSVDALPIDGGVALQAGALFGWVSLWLVPAAREALRLANPCRWRVPEIGDRARVLLGDYGTLAHLLSFAAPLISLWLTQLLWDPDRTTMGLLTLGAAVCHGFAWAGFRRVRGGEVVSYTQAVAALLLSTLSLIFLLEGGTLLLVLAVEAAMLHLASRRLSDENVATIAHAQFIFVGLWLLDRLVLGVFSLSELGPGVFNAGAITDLLVVFLIAASSITVASGRVIPIYHAASHAALLVWFCRELTLLPGPADAYVTLAWGLTGAAMLVSGLRRDHAYLIKGGVATLFLVVAKLFLWDLAGLEPVWRVLLFLGFGGLFLLLSYHLRNLWNPADRDGTTEAAADLHTTQDELSHHSS